MKMIVTRPEHDITTRYLSSWAEKIIEVARHKGVDVFDLVGSKATKKELEGRIQKTSPHLIFMSGHGSDTSVTGHDNEVLVETETNYSLLEGKISYALSCNSGKILGKKVTEHHDTAYIDYKDEFIFVCDRNYLARPVEDPRAKPFMESSNQVMISLLKGHPAGEASARSKEAFKERYIHLLSSTADQDTVQVAQFLWWNWKNQVCLGDLSVVA